MASAFDDMCSSILTDLYTESTSIDTINLLESTQFKTLRSLMFEAIEVMDSFKNRYAISNRGQINQRDPNLRCLVDLITLFFNTPGNQTILKVGNEAVPPRAWLDCVESIQDGNTEQGPLSLYDKLKQHNSHLPPLDGVVDYAMNAPIDWDVVWCKVVGPFDLKQYEHYEALARDWANYSPEYSNAFKDSHFPGMPAGPNTPLASFSVWRNRVRNHIDPRIALSADPGFDKWYGDRILPNGRVNLK